MITISLCMIVKNEERCLKRCLSSAQAIADEIIIVDTGSTDKTKELAAEFTDKIYDFEWINDFAAARNYAFSKAACDYCLWLDADDMILPEDAELFLELKRTLPRDVNAVMLRYDTAFDAAGRTVFSCYRERLVRRSAKFRWREPVHEYIEVGGKVINGKPVVCHFPPPSKTHGARNINIYEGVLARGGNLSPRGLYYYARELFDHRRYSEAAQYFTAFLDGGAGWIEDNISACGRLAESYLQLGKRQNALHSLLRAFEYDTPRAEICCRLGYFFKEGAAKNQAVYWFNAAIAAGETESQASGWGFKSADFFGYIPHLELAVLHYESGEKAKAVAHNEAAAKIKPDSPAILHNRQVFDSN